jgi:pimeloyl-ACP methyl ester carboxylesterase
MAGAAYNLFRETADSLLYLALNGYKIRIVGHSLGGGVAALLGIYVLRHFEKQCVDDAAKISSDSVSINEDGFVRVYSYGTPSCVDSKLADHPRIVGLCTSVVLHGQWGGCRSSDLKRFDFVL